MEKIILDLSSFEGSNFDIVNNIGQQEISALSFYMSQTRFSPRGFGNLKYKEVKRMNESSSIQ